MFKLLILYAVIMVAAIAEATYEFRGLWIASVSNIDWPSSPKLNTEQQRQELDNYVSLVSHLNMNAIMLHVRPMGDALYKSEIEPWSAFLTSVQGRPPTPFWDPLEHLVTLAHSKGIQVHAWINPYRANIKPSWDGLAPNHMAVKYKEFAYRYGKFLWMDPGATVIQDIIIHVVEDILQRYKVDGIHADDYFYPYPDAGLQFPDNNTYQKYLSQGGKLLLDDWRRDNVNSLIKRLYNTTRVYKRKLSISPSAFYKPGKPGGEPSSIKGFDSYSGVFADTKLWFQQGWMDMFVPQFYHTIEDIPHSYATLLDWWLSVNKKNVSLCAGIGAYRLDPVDGDWNTSEVIKQVELSREPENRQRGSIGNVIFSGRTLKNDVKNIKEQLKEHVYQNN